ncbi:MAG TPA: sodium:solute symporter [Clostridium sp.]|uniref:sodium:solute symporter family protein n=1 Tax=Clostridium sp. TaxID=1506 RepID=UPI002F930B2D
MKYGNVNPIWSWLVLFVYLGFCIYLGSRAYIQQKKSKNAEAESNDYWITGRSQPAYMVGMSIASGWMLIGMITWMTWATYDQGLAGLWLVAIPWLLSMVIQICMVPFIRRIKAISQCQMLQNRFGMSARVFSAFINIFSYTIWSAAELYAASLIMAPALHISVFWMIVIYAVPIAIYLCLGGFRSVINANILQFFMGATILLVVVISMYSAARGIASGNGTTIWTMLGHQNVINGAGYPYNSVKPATSLFGYTSIALPLVVMFGLLPGWGGAEDFWLKAQSAISTKAAIKGGIYSLFFNAFVIVIPSSLIGLFGLIIFKPVLNHGVLAAAVALGDKGGYDLISVYINNYMSPLLKSFLIFLLSAHSMSTVANYSNVCSMNLSYDVLQPLIYKKRNWSDEKIIKWSRIITVLIIILNMGLAWLYNIPSFGSSLNDAYFLSSGLLSAAVAIMLYSMFWKRANLRGVMTGGICGALGTFIFFILEYKVWKFSYNMPVFDWIFGKGALASTLLGYCVIGVLAGMVGLIIGTYLAPPPSAKLLGAIADKPCDNNEEFFKDMS